MDEDSWGDGYVWGTCINGRGEECLTNIHLESPEEVNQRGRWRTSTTTWNQQQSKITNKKKKSLNLGKNQVKKHPSKDNEKTLQNASNYENDARTWGNSDSDCDTDESKEDNRIIKNIKDGPPLFEFKICYDLKFSENNCYKMKSLPRGKVLVYNFNETKRTGSEFDVKNLRNIFLRLGYKVKIIEDCRAEIFKKTLREECNETDLESMDSFILFIMTHGTSKYLYMKDDEPISLNYVEEQLDGKNAPLLINKPKLMFIQACRDGNDSSSSQVEFDAREETQPHYKADILVSHSTYKGFKSARIPDKGTWFIRALVLVLEKHAHEWSYSDIMICVHRIVNKIFEQDHAQMPEKRDTATYNFFFSPIKINSLIAQADPEFNGEKAKEVEVKHSGCLTS